MRLLIWQNYYNKLNRTIVMGGDCKKIKISCSETISANFIPLSILHSSSRITLRIQSISFSEGAFYLVEWTLSYWYPFSNSASTYLCWVQQNSWARHERFVNNIRRVLLAGVCWFNMTSAKLSAISVDEEKKSPLQ